MSLIDELTKELTPTDALIFYQCGQDVYVEHRGMAGGRMGAGQPLDASQLARLARCAEKYAREQVPMTRVGGAIPRNLLYAQTDTDTMRLVWWRGPEEGNLSTITRQCIADDTPFPVDVMKRASVTLADVLK